MAVPIYFPLKTAIAASPCSNCSWSWSSSACSQVTSRQKFFAHIGKSEVKAARAQIDSLEKALDAYRLDTGGYPTTEHGLAALVQAPSGVAHWDGPYLKRGVPNDPWGHPYQYKQPG